MTTSEPSSTNEFGQPVGRSLSWAAAAVPVPKTLAGASVGLEPLGIEQAGELFEAVGRDARIWTYLPADAPASVEDLAAILRLQLDAPDSTAFVIRSPDGRALGSISYLRIQPEIGSIEVGWVTFGPDLQRTRAATEAQYLLMRHAFDDLGYRRYEWKCDSLNAPSRRAAARLGFTEEGTWRNALVTKGRNRDTTWLSITVEEWPSIRAAFEAWLSPDNFSSAGAQLTSLEALRARP